MVEKKNVATNSQNRQLLCHCPVRLSKTFSDGTKMRQNDKNLFLFFFRHNNFLYLFSLARVFIRDLIRLAMFNVYTSWIEYKYRLFAKQKFLWFENPANSVNRLCKIKRFSGIWIFCPFPFHSVQILLGKLKCERVLSVCTFCARRCQINLITSNKFPFHILNKVLYCWSFGSKKNWFSI